MSNLGIGVMIQVLGGNADSVAAYESALGKTIESASLVSDVLQLRFTDGTGISVSDEGQSCCESRYMNTDDDLTYYSGAELRSLKIEDAPSLSAEDQYGDHEIQFLIVETSRGAFTMQTHNEHNGYYGGFAVRVAVLP